MKKDQIMALSRQFFIETRGGTRPTSLSAPTFLKIQENLESIEQVNTPGVKRMVDIFKNM